MSDSKVNELVVEMQKIVYGMLCDIDDFCKENGLTYYLSGGTCLGAVRHRGFIPWDDDADIMLPRKDYELFLDKFSALCDGKYRVGALKQDEQWMRPAARIWDLNSPMQIKALSEEQMGIFVDVYPIDGLPEQAFSRKVFFKKIWLLNVLRISSLRKVILPHEKYKFTKRILMLLMKPFRFNARAFAQKQDAYARKYDYDTSKYVAASMATHYWDKETIERKHIDHAIYLPFISRLFPVPNGYDQYLKNLYGDYMEIPKDAAEKGYSHLDYYNIKFNISPGGVLKD